MAEHDDNLNRITAAVKSLTHMVTNETHAWNLWNYIASDRGAIRDALLRAWDVDTAALDAERAKNTEARLHVMEFHQHSDPLCSDCHTIHVLGGKD